MGPRSGGVVGRSDHLLPAALSVLVLPIAMSLERSRIVSAIATTKVAGGLGFPAEGGLDDLFTGGILGGDI
jgi:hypothetical protein